jgi:hypothetical protein
VARRGEEQAGCPGRRPSDRRHHRADARHGSRLAHRGRGGIVNVPTEEEIRAAIAREWGVQPGQDSVTGDPVGLPIEVEFSDGVGATMRLLDGLFDVNDLRDSEEERLNELVYAAVDPIRDETRRRIDEAVVSAALAFAAEHPDAPRATRLAIVPRVTA